MSLEKSQLYEADLQTAKHCVYQFVHHLMFQEFYNPIVKGTENILETFIILSLLKPYVLTSTVKVLMSLLTHLMECLNEDCS